jgi:hypothetical protein
MERQVPYLTEPEAHAAFGKGLDSSNLSVEVFPMRIHLSRNQIDSALPRAGAGIEKYHWLQSRVDKSVSFYRSAKFRRRFNGFYRIRRGEVWQDAYFRLMGEAHRKRYTFSAILRKLHQATGRYEASFASKMYATLNPDAPVIDSIVLKNLRLRLPYATQPNRIAGIIKIHEHLQEYFASYLGTADGQYLVRSFDHRYPKSGITNVKKLDFVLWQTR